MIETRQFTIYRLPFLKRDEPWNWLLAAAPFPTADAAAAEKARLEAAADGLSRFKIVSEPKGFGE